MTGPRLPCRDYKLAQLAVGSYADVIPVAGNPLKHVLIPGAWETGSIWL
jgi:hypothetical protein